MRYHVIYLAAGEEATTHVEAPNAAAAVHEVGHARCRAHGHFELLSVVPDDGDEETADSA